MSGILVIISLLSVSFVNAHKHHKSYESKAPACKTRQSCLDLNSNCQCFCGVKGDYRHKFKQDKPIFYANKSQDPFGKGCYCAPRDLKILEAEANGMPHWKAVDKYQYYKVPRARK